MTGREGGETLARGKKEEDCCQGESEGERMEINVHFPPFCLKLQLFYKLCPSKEKKFIAPPTNQG